MYKYMVVDDEELERRAIQIIIKRFNLPFECVAEAGHGAEATEKAAATMPDLVFMDINMPGINGLEAAEEIMKICPQCRIVFLTAYDQFEYARKGLQIGATEYLLKPVRPEMVEETCTKVMRIIEYANKQKAEHGRLRQELDASQPFIQNAFVYNLLLGNYSDYDEYKSRIDYLDIGFARASVIVVSIIKRDRQITSTIYEVINRLLQTHPCYFIVPINLNRIAIMLGQKSGKTRLSLACLKIIAVNILDKVAEESGSKLALGIGRIYTDPWDLQHSYTEACNAVNLAELLMGQDSVLYIDECNRFYSNIPHYSLEIEKMLTEKVSQGDINMALNYTSELYKSLIQTFNYNLIWAKARCLQILGVLCRVASDAKVEPEELFIINAGSVNVLVELSEIEELGAWLNNCVTEITSLIVKRRELSSHRVVKVTQEYIEINLEKNIAVGDITKLVYLNPQYFSRLFKRETGMTFIEYLTYRRIERAKRLLKNEGLPVSLVAKKVGFSDSNYFSRVFNKEVGIPPSKYANDASE